MGDHVDRRQEFLSDIEYEGSCLLNCWSGLGRLISGVIAVFFMAWMTFDWIFDIIITKRYYDKAVEELHKLYEKVELLLIFQSYYINFLAPTSESNFPPNFCTGLGALG